MLRLAWKGVQAHRLRLALTGLAIVLGVAFVSGSFVFTDSIRSAFDDLFTDVNKGVDLYVRGVNAFGEDVGRVPDDVLAEVAAIDGVARAVPSVEGFARLIDADGDPIGGSGPPTFGFSYVPEGEGLTPLRIAAGAYPLGPGEVMIDAFSAEANDIAVGDHITVVVVTGPESFDVVGLAAFGEADNLLGATLALFDLGHGAARSRVGRRVLDHRDRDRVGSRSRVHHRADRIVAARRRRGGDRGGSAGG